MSAFALLGEVRRLPHAFDADAARRRREALLEAAEEHGGADPRAALGAFAAAPAGGALLDAILGNSAFLSHALVADPGHFLGLAENGVAASFAAIIAATSAGAREIERLKPELRRLRLRAAVTAAVADIGHVWDLGTVTRALSDFADAAIAVAVRAALAGVGIADPARSGYVVFALGKHGGRELNYSSDVDLVVLWDPERAEPLGDGAEAHFVRVTQAFVAALADRTPDGYVFRVDLRLRPDASATPIALSLRAAEAYYESAGLGWERAAWIKARPIAGDIDTGAAFLRRLAPFVWRKHLDFAAIDEIHGIKRRIQAHYGHGAIRVRGHNVKVGRGGIREIEFFAQSQQLVAGGRDRRLRVPDTCSALAALATAGAISPAVAAELTAAYGTLRTVEHRLQMLADEQIHTIPADATEFARIATFLGYDDPQRCDADVRRQLEIVAGHYARLFEQRGDAADPARLVFAGSADDPRLLEALTAAGFAEPASAAEIVAGWQQGRYRATRAPQARALLGKILPEIAKGFGATAYPDAALARFDRMLAALPAGVQLFSLFQAHPELLALVAEVMGTAPRLADVLSHRPGVLDAALQPGFFEPLPDAGALRADLEASLSNSVSLEDALDRARRWAVERKFQIGVQVMRGRADVNTSGRMHSDVADAAIGALLDRVRYEFAHVFGDIAESQFAVMALGKLGAREMTAGSDLDLVFVYDFPASDALSSGPRSLPAATYFARLSQRLVAAISAPTAEGRLYEVDMRLRPSGSQGPVATRAEGFLRYQRQQAWVLEHMAMTRARFVTGDAALGARIASGVREALRGERDYGALARDVSWLRTRVAEEHPAVDPWDVKYVRGGLMDAEMLCQFLQLRRAAAHPEVIGGDTAAAFRALHAAGAIDAGAAAELVAATILLRGVQGFLRETLAAKFDVESAPPGLLAALARFAGHTSFGDLRAALVDGERRVYQHFQHFVLKA